MQDEVAWTKSLFTTDSLSGTSESLDSARRFSPLVIWILNYCPNNTFVCWLNKAAYKYFEHDLKIKLQSYTKLCIKASKAFFSIKRCKKIFGQLFVDLELHLSWDDALRRASTSSQPDFIRRKPLKMLQKFWQLMQWFVNNDMLQS